ncbi:hypothetical protein FNV43_RR16106 [Rhamnella rubrinervis]|uniref:1-phosphatidylinositol 4-kinase n=1 Tax=Rhamnella rubrinervis TaxID=2594499 RepID=A0A8K0E2Y9_9ROSA|nr:hypothetical protein FNV43_RR16106 [Rhamnella rubrinervis]
MAVAVDQRNGFKPFSRTQRCRLQSYTHLDQNIFELNQTKFVQYSLKQAFKVANFHRSFSTPCISLTTAVDEDYFEINPKIEILGGHKAPGVRALVVEVAIAIASGVDPVPVSSGLGGAYLLRSLNGDNIAVAKPVDEEPLALNNPKGFVGRTLGEPGIKRSVRIGETGFRELAAYLLDHGGFAGVPPTALVKISNVAFNLNNAATAVVSSSTVVPYKIASLQHFVDHDYDAGELGPSGFSVASVHRIGIFDVRLLNLDRHAGNILVKKHDDDVQHMSNNIYAVGAAELVPIDHGLCLPEWLDDPYFEWLHWPQASVPFSESEVDYISNLDPFKDAELLRAELPSLREACIRVLVLCTIFLKQAAAAGLCLAEIGEMMSREFCGGEDKLSTLENVCAQARASLPSSSILLEHEHDDHDHDHEHESKILTEEFDDETFQFDYYDQSDRDTYIIEGLDLPQLLQSHPDPRMAAIKPPKTSRFASAGSSTRLPDAALLLSPLYEENDDGDVNKFCNKVGGFTGRSVSFSVSNHNYASGVISFADMSQDDWDLFLKSFQKLLPEVFESTKFLGQKQRLGTSSCKF